MLYYRPSQPVGAAATSHAAGWFLAAYLICVIYVSWYPFVEWHSIEQSPIAFLWAPWPRYWSVFDVTANLIAYIPLGILFAVVLAERTKLVSRLLACLLLSGAISLLVEAVQSYLPTRVPSRLDLTLNAIGGLIGAVLVGERAKSIYDFVVVRALHRQWLNRGTAPALFLLLSWCFLHWLPQSQLFAIGFMPKLGLRMHVYSPLTETIFWGDPVIVMALEVVSVGLSLWIVAMLVLEVFPEQINRLVWGSFAVAVAVFLKTLTAVLMTDWAPTYWLTSGAQAGLLFGCLAALVCTSLSRRWRLIGSVLACLAIVWIANYAPISDYAIHTIDRWNDRYLRSVAGPTRHLNAIWPLLLILWCFYQLQTRRTASNELLSPASRWPGYG